MRKKCGVVFFLRKNVISLIIIVLALAAAGCGKTEVNRDILYQVSTINALTEGAYGGQLSCGELKKQGDFGIGTFEGLDGEMILLDGSVYQVKADGFAYPAADDAKTPFACVTFFDPDNSLKIYHITDYENLKTVLDSLNANKNVFYAVKITGDFKYVKTRSVPKQQKPYPPLVEVTAKQPTFEFNDVKGVLVGFYCPAMAQGINVPGYHLHFLSSDKKSGGHLLECQVQNANVEIDTTPVFQMVLPTDEESGRLNLAGDKSKEIEKAEK